MKLLIIGNCQASIISKILQLRYHNAKIDVYSPMDYVNGKISCNDFSTYSHVLIQDQAVLKGASEHGNNCLVFPNILFSGFILITFTYQK